MVNGRLDDRGELVARMPLEKRRRHRTAVDADADGEVVVARDVDQPLYLVRNRLGLFDVMEMAWVIADLVDVRRDLVGDTVVFLQVDRKRHTRGLCANFLER